jgi:beta-N-acetylhexosaminidase
MAAGLGLGLLITVSACGNGGDGSPATSSPGASGTSSATGSTTASGSSSPSVSGSATHTTTVAPPPAKPTTKPASCVDRTANAMSDAQRVGELFMTAVSTSGLTSAESTAITRGRVGSVILMGHTSAGTAAVKKVTDRVRTLAPTVKGAKVGMFISTDQEGGKVQVLNGPGFSAMPAAVTQGKWSTGTLRSNATTWGRQLRAAGVNMNLAPVADTVPANLVSVNAPIGQLDREYGNDPGTVASHSTAFLQGMLKAGVVPTAKHFPGLGRVQGNTDLAANVKDTVTTRNDPYLQPFRSAVQAGTPFVMISSAIYTRIDPAHQAAFSSIVIRDMLRGSLGFKGAVISDDLGQAVAVADHTPAQRALDFIGAGGNIVLTVKPSDIVPMTNAVLSRLPHDSALRADVNDSVHKVLTAKQNAGVLSCG